MQLSYGSGKQRIESKLCSLRHHLVQGNPFLRNSTLTGIHSHLFQRRTLSTSSRYWPLCESIYLFWGLRLSAFSILAVGKCLHLTFQLHQLWFWLQAVFPTSISRRIAFLMPVLFISCGFEKAPGRLPTPPRSSRQKNAKEFLKTGMVMWAIIINSICDH